MFPQSWYDTQWSERQGISIDSDHIDFGNNGSFNADYVSQNDPASYLTFQAEEQETQPRVTR